MMRALKRPVVMLVKAMTVVAGTLVCTLLMGTIVLNTFITDSEIAAPAVSAAGTCTLYPDSTSHTWQVSCNGGAYSSLITTATGSGLYCLLTGGAGCVLTGTMTNRGTTVQTATATDDQLVLNVAAGGAGRFAGTIQPTDLTAARTYMLPDWTGTVPVPTTVGTTTTVLHGNAAAQPVFGSVVQADVSNGYVDQASAQATIAGAKTWTSAATFSAGATFSTAGTVNTSVLLDPRGGITNQGSTTCPGSGEGPAGAVCVSDVFSVQSGSATTTMHIYSTIATNESSLLNMYTAGTGSENLQFNTGLPSAATGVGDVGYTTATGSPTGLQDMVYVYGIAKVVALASSAAGAAGTAAWKLISGVAGSALTVWTIDGLGNILIDSGATRTRGTKALAGGTTTVTVNSGAVCTCNNVSAATVCVPSVSGTTLTLTSGAGTDTVAYHCF